MAQKPLTAAQKKVLYHLALALRVMDIEEKVLKPGLEKDGKPFKPGEFSRMYFEKVPEVAQVERAFKKAAAQADRDLAASFKRGNQDD
ncbi:hypothetical protein [Shewanella algae]|uniref:hypothetical protein n=1 Tax=Shewanella algae TaxID=38313 RepID=UPI0031F589B3